ncbi:MAG: hypothetical protein JXA19_07235 [Anaerolineales bacterium]|nr:hypothetical protein [Anaerolineales bacterium]
MQRTTVETLLTHLEKAWNIESLRISPDLRQVSYSIKNRNQMNLVINGRNQTRFDSVGFTMFSPNSQHFAYAAATSGKQFVVCDKKIDRSFTSVFQNTITYSPDSSKLAYVAQDDSDFFLLINGQVSSPYKDICKDNPPLFSPDNQMIAFQAGNGEKQFFVLNGEVLQEYDQVKSPFFSPENRHFAYIAFADGFQKMVLDGTEQKFYDSIIEPQFSSTGELHYAAEDNWKWYVVSDGIESAAYDQIKTLVISPDGKRTGFAARKGEKWIAVIDGKESPAYDGVGQITFSPDSQRIAFMAMESEKKGLFRTVDRSFVVLDFEKGPDYSGIGKSGFTFSPDSEHFAYTAHHHGQVFVVQDGKESLRFDSVGQGTPVYSPDSQHLLYCAAFNQKFSIIVDETTGNIFSSIILSKGGKITFEAPNKFLYLVLIKEDIFLVEETIQCVE